MKNESELNPHVSGIRKLGFRFNYLSRKSKNSDPNLIALFRKSKSPKLNLINLVRKSTALVMNHEVQLVLGSSPILKTPSTRWFPS